MEASAKKVEEGVDWSKGNGRVPDGAQRDDESNFIRDPVPWNKDGQAEED